MTEKYHGSCDELEAIVASTGIKGDWSDDGAGKHTFRSRTGGMLNWWESKGTLLFQGSADAKKELEQSIIPLLSQGVKTQSNLFQQTEKKQIFIVHGHDAEARDQLELALRRLDLEPYILMNTSGQGKTIIEALEGCIGRDYSSAFGISLLTPDDIGYAKKDGAEKGEPRARQNVILETGMLLASLTRERIAIIVKGHIELPSDLEGIIRFGYNEHIREVVPKLCQRLKEAGFQISSDKIAAAV